ncbi:YIP1 family protein [Pseudooceanicola sp.]|uniref:YIP1 family protein n=1 Tax=Pseudooceanicola sp. TaxID=1914328 RepID=UPI003511ACB6
MLPDPSRLAVLTVRDPAEAARQILDLNLPRQALWLALLLMAVLQSLIFALSDLMTPGPTPFPALFGSPIRFMIVSALMLVLTVYAIFWAGRALRGSGALEDVMALVVWLQALRVAVQLAGLLLSMVIPLLAVLLLLAASVLGIYILLHFINQAHRLDSIARAVGVLAVALVGLLFGLSLLLALLGVPAMGNAGYV